MSLKLELKHALPWLLMGIIIVGEFLLLAPLYPYDARVVNTTITLPFGLKDCEPIVWGGGVGVGQRGWITVDVGVLDPIIYTEPFNVVIEDPFGPTFFNETSTRIQAVLPAGWLFEGYRVSVENPGTTCDGPAIAVVGVIEFWHTETRRTSILFPLSSP